LNERTITLTPLWRAFLKAAAEHQVVFFHGGLTYSVAEFAEDELRRR
jgi:hypothetical protein